MATIELAPYQNFNIKELEDFFVPRGWKVDLVKASNYDLVQADQGAALECIDGRYANLERRKKNGPKIPGALNAIAALKTGGDMPGFYLAARLAQTHGFNPGTHGAVHEGPGCGYHSLWENEALTSSMHRYTLPMGQSQGRSCAEYLKRMIKVWGGKHFRLPVVHEEEALVLNPHMGTTVIAMRDRFIYDKWLMRKMGIGPMRSALIVAETIENLAPHLPKRVEIIIP